MKVVAMKVVVDTNVLLISLPKISKYRPIFNGLLQSVYTLAISTEILNEYVEIISQKTKPIIADNIGGLLTQLSNVEKTEVSYRWNLIIEDVDDNKFVDCAIAAQADYIVTNDKHFNILKDIDFPKTNVISADEFLDKVLAIK